MTRTRDPSRTEHIVDFRRLVEQAPVTCYVSTSNPDSCILYIAPNVERLLGYAAPAWIEDPEFFMQRVHPDDRELVSETFRNTQMTGRQLDLAYRMIARDGNTVWVRNVATRHDAGEDAHRVIHGMLLDITVQKEIEGELRSRDAARHRLIEASTRVNAERSLHGVLREVADSARRVIGCRYAALGILDASGNAIANFVVSGIPEDAIADIGALPTGKGILGLLIKHKAPIRIPDLTKHPEAHGFPANHPPMRSFLGVPVLGSDGPYGNLYFTEKEGNDAFTEDDEAVAVMFAANAAVAVRNARLDEEGVQLLSNLQSLQSTRDRFYAMINHELRNALTAVHGWSELLLRKAGSDPPRPVIETVESAEYALQLLNDLLDLSRLDAEMLSVHVEETDARELAQSAASQLEPVASAGGVNLDVDCDDVDTTCTTDDHRIRQIIVNLLSNAIRHSPYGSTVTLHVGVNEQEVHFDVIDRGEGIGPQELAIIFDAYVRAETRAGGGTGLGLTLSSRLARLLGGDLAVSSQLGKGAHFTLTVPRHLRKD